MIKRSVTMPRENCSKGIAIVSKLSLRGESSPRKRYHATQTDHTTTMNAQKLGDEALPPYVESVPQGLSFTADFGHYGPLTVHMKGDYRSPDFDIVTFDKIPLFHLETDSTLIYHVTYVKDLRPNGPRGIAHTIKRKTDGDRYQYSAVSPGKDGVRYLEIETTSKILTGASTKLVFRSAVDGELDAIYLKTEVQKNRRTALVEYRGKKIGEIQQLGGDDRPKFSLIIDIPRVDPLLFACLAYVLDDRLMTSRRRLRRPLGAGFTGIGKGPGAGLAGAYAIGGMV